MSDRRPEVAPPAARTAGRRRVRVLLLSAAVFLLAGGWWWYGRSHPRAEPPLPSGIEDQEVRAVVEEARKQVLADSRSAGTWGRLGMVYLANSFEPDADRCFAEAARLDPADPRWPYGRGRIALLRDPERAVALLREAVSAAGPGSKYRSTILIQLAEALIERQQLDEAEDILHGEEGKSEYGQRVAYDLGLIALARNDRPAATQYLELASQSPVVRQRAAALLATLARTRGDQSAAVRYETASAAAPSGLRWPDPFASEVVDLQVGQAGVRARAQRLEEEGRYEEAAELLQQLARAQLTARSLTEAGMNFTRAGNIDQAMPLLREAVQLDSNSPQARYNLALTLFTQAEKENIRRPGTEEVRAAFEEVVQHASRAAELKPDHAMAYLFWGLSLKHLGRTEAAVEPLRKGVAARPEEFELQLALGEILITTGRGAEAKAYLDNAARLDPKDPRPGQALARLKGTGK